MIDIGITKMSTKGQIVIPNDLRKEFKIGEKLIIIKSDNKFIIKKISEMDNDFIEDIEFMKKTEDSLERYKEGEFEEMKFDNFIEEMKKW